MNEKEVTALGDKFGTVPSKAGTGPYYPTEYTVATGVKLQAFDQYWGGAPNIKRVEYRVISDDATVQVAFRNKELDYLEDASLSNWDTLKAEAGPDNNVMIKGNNIHFMAVNYQSPTNNNILANDKVRQAIFYAVNKDDINKAMAGGMGMPAITYMPNEYVPTSPVTGFETYKFNQAKAKELLIRNRRRTAAKTAVLFLCWQPTSSSSPAPRPGCCAASCPAPALPQPRCGYSTRSAVPSALTRR